ncbi:hypothetical protein K9M79_03295 [Candidatus Woesearchaeota archaeon]|nr:hypothetical protein [Candidatus Woesearchaeota archaeon]
MTKGQVSFEMLLTTMFALLLLIGVAFVAYQYSFGATGELDSALLEKSVNVVESNSRELLAQGKSDVRTLSVQFPKGIQKIFTQNGTLMFTVYSNGMDSNISFPSNVYYITSAPNVAEGKKKVVLKTLGDDRVMFGVVSKECNFDGYCDDNEVLNPELCLADCCTSDCYFCDSPDYYYKCDADTIREPACDYINDCTFSAMCGDGSCTFGETHDNCPIDCTLPECGNGVCDGTEDFASCSTDCPCNEDGTCDYPREDTSCLLDCGCDYDNVCEQSDTPPEGPGWCSDCPCNNDGTCDRGPPNEDHDWCPSDCECDFDLVCDFPREDTSNCVEDCACDTDGICKDTNPPFSPPLESWKWCRDECPCDYNNICDDGTGGTTDYGENNVNCLNDCPIAEEIVDCNALQAMLTDHHYYLSGDLDCSATAGWPNGFVSIGTPADPFRGGLNGMGFAIYGMTIKTSNSEMVGMFGYVNDSDIRNLELRDLDIQGTGNSQIGALAGVVNHSDIVRVNVSSSSILGKNYVGGLIGKATNSNILGSNASVTVTSTGNQIGALVGRSENTNITFSMAEGTVTSTGTGMAGASVGGLVGEMYRDSFVGYSYSNVTVSGNIYVGGIVGYLKDNSNISQTLNIGEITGNSYVGGIAGQIGDGFDPTDLYDSYAQCNVNGNSYVGGIVGKIVDSNLNRTYFVGQLNDTGATFGGVTGDSLGTISETFWNNIEYTWNNGLGEGKSSAEMLTQATYDNPPTVNWDFTTIWGIDAGEYPYLRIIYMPTDYGFCVVGISLIGHCLISG